LKSFAGHAVFIVAGAARFDGAASSNMMVGVGWTNEGCSKSGDDVSNRGNPNKWLWEAWIRIDPDGKITFGVPRAEVGQGVQTGIPMLIAEELEVDLETSDVEVVHPVLELKAYTNYALGFESARPLARSKFTRWIGKKIFSAVPLIMTGGSSSIVDGWKRLRIVGASARLMLIEAAANRWGVRVSECYAENGHIIHRPTRKKLHYGEIAAEAAKINPPKNPLLKPDSQFKVIGKPVPRIEIPAKVDGRAGFGIDVNMPDMLYATVKHSPIFGGTVEEFDPERAQSMPGVIKVHNLKSAVAVIADSYWHAKNALDQIEINWDDKGNGEIGSKEIREEKLEALNRKKGHVVKNDGRGD
jgi:isoquinoline 1-oxidoreductase beta subunit